MPGKNFRWAILDAPVAKAGFAAAGETSGARLARAVTQAAFGQHDDAVFEVLVDGALRGEADPTFASERVQAGGHGEALREEGDEAFGETVRHHGAPALRGLGLLGAALGKEGGVFRIHPAATRSVAHEKTGVSGLQLALQAAVRKFAKFGEGAHGERLVPAFHIFIPKLLQGFASFPCPMFPNARKCATLLHVGVPF